VSELHVKCPLTRCGARGMDAEEAVPERRYLPGCRRASYAVGNGTRLRAPASTRSPPPLLTL
jgi:hypothetical protein